ncbi:MAG: SsrA-binding protein SmpB [Lachnospiraceae bacterium]|nr:SsrA-binding protein SmpB [Lachnospiraceae bacterium]
MAKEKTGRKIIATNRKARHDYFLDEYIECGIVLVGTEVKSLRAGGCSLKEAWVRIQNGEVWIYQMHIAPYEKGNIMNKDPLRPRKLLLHKNEILKLEQKIKEKGYTLVPVEAYFKDSKVKIEIALARGKKLYDKRADIAKRDQQREAAREFKVRNLG